MTTEQKIEAIRDCIERAKNHQSKMDQVAWSVPALSSIKLRHLMNNLGSLSTRYMEHGTHRGGIFCSVLRNNPNIEIAYWGDCFASDKVTGENIQQEFIQNAIKCIEGTDTVLLGEVADTFDLPSNFADEVDLYCFDADHGYEAQRKAMTHFLPSMANEFIVCVDDWQYGDVKRGTIDGIADSGCEILFQEELLNPEPYTEDEHLNDLYWRGFFVALLKKK
jgi:methyltransferase family protein